MHRLAWSQWLSLAAAVMALRMGITALWATSLVWLVLAQSMHALTFAAHHSVSMAMVERHFLDRLRARGQALYAVIGYGVSGLVGGALGGWLSSRWGLSSVFWLAALSAVAAWLALLLQRRQAQA